MESKRTSRKNTWMKRKDLIKKGTCMEKRRRRRTWIKRKNLIQFKNKQVNKWQPIKRCSLNKIKIKTKGPWIKRYQPFKRPGPTKNKRLSLLSHPK